jgi:hypothetical protein
MVVIGQVHSLGWLGGANRVIDHDRSNCDSPTTTPAMLSDREESRALTPGLPERETQTPLIQSSAARPKSCYSGYNSSSWVVFLLFCFGHFSSLGKFLVCEIRILQDRRNNIQYGLSVGLAFIANEPLIPIHSSATQYRFSNYILNRIRLNLRYSFSKWFFEFFSTLHHYLMYILNI